MLVIIQARSNSKRFKNKVVKLILGKPMIWHLIQRIKKSKNVNKIVVATSKKKFDDKFVKYLEKIKINYFRGDLYNVVKRMYDVAKKNKVNYFLRISGDSPLIDPKVIDKAILLHNKYKNKYDIITNIFPRSFPKGQSVEIIKKSILIRFMKFMNLEEKEHVSRYFYNNHTKFKIKNFKSQTNKNKINLCVDTPKDFKFITKKYKKIFMNNLNTYEN